MTGANIRRVSAYAGTAIGLFAFFVAWFAADCVGRGVMRGIYYAFDEVARLLIARYPLYDLCGYNLFSSVQRCHARLEHLAVGLFVLGVGIRDLILFFVLAFARAGTTERFLFGTTSPPKSERERRSWGERAAEQPSQSERRTFPRLWPAILVLGGLAIIGGPCISKGDWAFDSNFGFGLVLFVELLLIAFFLTAVRHSLLYAFVRARRPPLANTAP